MLPQGEESYEMMAFDWDLVGQGGLPNNKKETKNNDYKITLGWDWIC
jgi:hypothetical protein